MSKDILWVAMRDGKGWNSSRTRDLVDVAFTVYKETDIELCRVEIRQPLDSSDPKSRAVRVICRAFFTDHFVAKKKLIEYVDSCNNSGLSQDLARNVLMTMMLDNGTPNPQSFMYVGDVVTTQTEWLDSKKVVASTPLIAPTNLYNATLPKELSGDWTKLTVDLTEAMNMLSDFEVANEVVATEEFNVAEHVESLPLEIDLSAGGMYVAPTTEEVINAMLEEIKEETAARQEALQAMVEMVEEIQAEVEPAFDPSTWSVGDPVPAGYLVFGGKLKKMEWPK